MKESAEQYRNLNAAELGEKLQTGAEQMFRLRFGLSMGQTDGVKKLRQLRKERARILTVMQQRGEKAPALHAPVADKKGARKSASRAAAKKKK